MKRLLALLTTLTFASWASAPVATVHSPQPRSDWSAVDAALGRSGAAQPGNVYKLTY